MSDHRGAPLPADHRERERLVRDGLTNFAVGAGAGSGKTRVLVERIIGLVDGGVDLERIVGITFTDKAAAELRERVRDGLSRPSNQPSEAIERNRKKALGVVDLSPLTTIHGFCRSLISTHPIEAGIVPGFLVLDQLASDLLLESVVATEVEKLKTSTGSALQGPLLAGARLNGLRDLVKTILRFPDLETELPASGSESVDEVIADLLDEARAITTFADVVGFEDRLIRKAFEVLDREPALTGPESDIHDRAATLERLKINGKAGAKKNWRVDGEALVAFGRLKPAWGVLADRGKDAIAGYKSDMLRIVVETAMETGETFRRRKEEMGALDFDDLLLVTRRLLESDAGITQDVKEQYDCILIDEFQDTDPIQAGIVMRLAEDPGVRAGRVEKAIPGEGRLFLVGDANQSIYRFRRADLPVFRKARDQVLEAGREAMLAVNFRSTPGLVSVANLLFRDILPDGDYHDLSAWRGEGPPVPSVSLLDLDPVLERMRFSADGPGPKTDDIRTAEARALAGWIEERRSGKMPILDRKSGKERALEYGDIVILVRTYTGVRIFERELERCGIPCRLARGREFFRRLEVVQTIPVLRALADPSDEVAIVAALRSPYFGVSDESLVRLAASAGSLSYLEVLSESGNGYLDPQEDAPLFTARKILADLWHDAAFMEPSEVLRAIYDRTRSLPLHALKPDGERRMGNLLKMLDLAAAYEEAATTLAGAGAAEAGTLPGLVRYLEEQQQAAAEEESGLMGEGGGAVTIMTIHSAKGLEFPVVALLDRSYSSTFLDTAIPDREQGTVVVKGAGLEPADWPERKEREEEEQAGEGDRMLYVAFTRARDHVVTCGRASEEEPGKGFLQRLEIGLRRLASGEVSGAEGLVAWTSTTEPDPVEVRHHRLPRDLTAPSADEITIPVTEREAAQREWQQVVIQARSSRVARASGLGRWQEETRMAGEDAAEFPLELSSWYARLRGTRVHEAMELLISVEGSAEEVCRLASGPIDPPGLEDECRQLVEKGRALLAESQAEGWKPAATEWPMAATDIPEDLIEFAGRDIEVLTGTADLVLENDSGDLMVVDYKTGIVSNGALRDRYRGQLMAYRTLLAGATGRQVTSEIWALSTGERVTI